MCSVKNWHKNIQVFEICCNLITISKGLNLDQVTNAIVKIATFHSVAYAFNFYNPETVKKWNLSSWRENWLEDPGNAFNFCAEFQLLGSFSKQTCFKVLLS